MARPALSQDEITLFRDKLCEVALALFAQHGHQNVTMRAIARELECSHTTPYRYFESKEQLLISVRTMCFEQFNAFQQRRLKPQLSLREQLETLATGYILFACEHAEAFALMFDLSQVDLNQAPELKEAIRSAWRILHECMQRCVDSGYLAGEPKQMTYLFWSSIHGIVTLDLRHKLGPGWEPETITLPMLDALIRAHRPTPPEP